MATTAATPADATYSAPSPVPTRHVHTFVTGIVGAVAVAHLLNDLIQAVLPAIYPMLKAKYHLTFGQIGWLAMVYQITASLLQPWIGLHTDKHPKPWLLPCGMMVTLVGIGSVALANSYEALLIASAVIGPLPPTAATSPRTAACVAWSSARQ